MRFDDRINSHLILTSLIFYISGKKAILINFLFAVARPLDPAILVLFLQIK